MPGYVGDTPGRAAPMPTSVPWQPVSLPVERDDRRTVIRDITWCAGHWYAVGADVTVDGTTSPAVWHSTDAIRWQRLAATGHTHYGKLNILTAAACRDGRLAAVGSMSGGAHGNPRTSSWQQRPDGAVVEVSAGFELFGGPAAVNVGRIAAGAQGWLIVGNRIGGAAVWLSAEADRFDIVEDEPGLASDDEGRTWAHDAVAADDGWLVAGAIGRPGRTDRDPMLWESADGLRWQRVPVTGGPANEELQRLALSGTTPVAAGQRGEVFGAWRGGDDEWQQSGEFGSTDGPGVPLVRALAADGDLVVAVTSTGATHQLWYSTDGTRSWQELIAPTAVPASAEQVAVVAAGGGQLLILVDDATSVRAWRWQLD